MDFSSAHLANLFATPLVIHVWEDGSDVNPALRELILAHSEKSRGVVKSNDGGWHSETGQLEFCGEVGKRLVRYVKELGDEATRRVLAEHGQQYSPNQWTFNAWANINRSGDFNAVHVHPASTWSGTYYVDTGDPLNAEMGTPLHLSDPCVARSTTFLARQLPSHVKVQPRPGLTVLFPSYVPHLVYPHRGNSPRISIAFNLRFEPYP